MLQFKMLGVLTAGSATVGTVQLIDANTALPLALVLGAVLTSVGLAWRVATYVTNARRDMDAHERRIADLEQMLRSQNLDFMQLKQQLDHDARNHDRG